ncbi:MAG TPA: MASE1 domain-containing protein, partial [Burkholderiaceae bacterium]
MSELLLPRVAAALVAPLGLRAWATRTALLLVAYYLGARAGLSVPQFGNHITLIWPPTGIALAALLRFGLGVWPGVFAGATLVALTTGAPLWLALLVAFGNTVGPALAAWVLRRDGLHVELDRRRDLWLYGAIGVGLSMLITASNGTFWLAASGTIAWSDAPRAWMVWWLGDVMGALVVGIPLLTLSRASLDRAFGQWRWVSSSLLALGAGASAALAVVLAGRDAALQTPLFVVPHVLLVWLAARRGLFVASATAMLTTAGSVLAAAHGIGPFTLGSAGQGSWLLVGYACSLLVIPLLTTALTGEIAANERRWQLALDTSQIGVGEWDLARDRIEFSTRWLALLGHTSQVFGHSLQSFWSLLHPDDLAQVQRAFEPLRAAGAINCRAECRMLCRDGRWLLFELHALVAERGVAGEPIRIINTAREIGEVQAARERQDLSQRVFQHLHEGLLITDAQHRVLEANPTFTEITGYPHGELLGAVPPLLRPGEAGSDLASQQALMRAALETDGHWRGELHHQRRNGEPCLLRLAVTAVRNPDGAVRNHVLAVTDITHERLQLEQLQRQAHFDELTRLPNRVRLAQM